MVRFLSAEWFAKVAAASEPETGPARAVLEQVVDGAPGGRVSYRVVVGERRARIEWPTSAGAPPADLRISCDWPTAVAIARGDLSTHRALMDGRLRVKGNPARDGGLPAGLDPVPASVRAETTY